MVSHFGCSVKVVQDFQTTTNAPRLDKTEVIQLNNLNLSTQTAGRAYCPSLPEPAETEGLNQRFSPAVGSGDFSSHANTLCPCEEQ